STGSARTCDRSGSDIRRSAFGALRLFADRMFGWGDVIGEPLLDDLLDHRQPAIYELARHREARALEPGEELSHALVRRVAHPLAELVLHRLVRRPRATVGVRRVDAPPAHVP